MKIAKIFRHSFWVCWKDVLEIVRNRLALVMLVVMPFFMMLMVGFIFPTMDSMSDVPVAIANRDAGENGTMLADPFLRNFHMFNNRTEIFDITSAGDMEELKSDIRNGEISGGILLSEDFTASLLAGRTANITIITDQSNPQLSLMVQSALKLTIEQIGTMRAKETLNETYGVDTNDTGALIKPYHVTVKGIIPGDPNYFQFVAPGIMGMVVMMSLMTGLPHAISYEKDMGTLDGMLVAPINRSSIILGKVMAQTIRGMLQGTIILVLAMLVFDVKIYGSILLVFFLLILGVYGFVGLGILITSFADTEETASMIMMSLMFPMMIMSGVFFPMEQMPWFMQYVSKVLPLTYSTTALRKVIVLGGGISNIAFEVIFMAVFGTVMLIIAVPVFKRAMNK
ncbi:MAG: ABC transporter permease [Candidatus Thermoplasmatota archaeon]|nr:ABC transporter permease [Candidatus Thermoplasmatota archaeon]